jgi:DNA invertase Pin-like site-specific DNA recombinase
VVKELSTNKRPENARALWTVGQRMSGMRTTPPARISWKVVLRRSHHNRETHGAPCRRRGFSGPFGSARSDAPKGHEDMKPRVALYARYSSDLQSAASIEDQLRLCEARAATEGWEIVNTYVDAAISGSSMMLRSGMQNLLQDALGGKFDIVLSESLDRLSRNLHDISGLHKQLESAGVRIFTLSEGEITTMHVGLKDTMSELFLKDLADKTRRGLRGKVENGKSGGGISYGYTVPKKFDALGQAIKGEREIDEEQAAIIRRSFEDYAHANTSPKTIAAQLNHEGIPSPSRKGWTQSTINSNRRRGTGILNNELYIGEMVWNRQRFIKNPNTGKRVARLNPEREWVRQEVPALRIIPQELWEAAKSRQAKLDEKTPGL